MPSATVVICTHDRAHLLVEVVGHALAEALTCDAEVLVVDNASTDHTPRLLTQLTGTHAPALRRAAEPQLGLSAARNRGLVEAHAEVAVFLDDDALPRAGWLGALIGPYASPQIACTGGKIVLAFPAGPPSWLTPTLATTLSAHDLGPTSRPYAPGEYPTGANISFRVGVARALGGFCTSVGSHGRDLMGHDETDLCCRLMRAGHGLMYVADAIVDHKVFVERLNPRWLLDRQQKNGESGALFLLRNYGLRHAVGWLRWHHWQHLGMRAYVPLEPVDPDRLLVEFRRREAVGYLVGLARAILRLRTLRRESSPPAASTSARARSTSAGACGTRARANRSRE